MPAYTEIGQAIGNRAREGSPVVVLEGRGVGLLRTLRIGGRDRASRESLVETHVLGPSDVRPPEGPDGGRSGGRSWVRLLAVTTPSSIRAVVGL